MMMAMIDKTLFYVYWNKTIFNDSVGMHQFSGPAERSPNGAVIIDPPEA